MPIEMPLFCSHETVTPSIQFGFKIPLVLLRGDCHLSTPCGCMHGCTYTHISQYLILVISNKTWMMDGFLWCIQGHKKTLSSLTHLLKCLALCSSKRGRKLWQQYVQLIFLSCEEQRAGKFELGVSGPHIDCLWRGRIKDTTMTDFSPK